MKTKFTLIPTLTLFTCVSALSLRPSPALGWTVDAGRFDRDYSTPDRPYPLPPRPPRQPEDDWYLPVDYLDPSASQLWNELAELFQRYNHDWDTLKGMFLKWFNRRYLRATTAQRKAFHVYSINDEGLLAKKPLHLLVSLMLSQNKLHVPGFDTKFDYSANLHSGVVPVSVLGGKDDPAALFDKWNPKPPTAVSTVANRPGVTKGSGLDPLSAARAAFALSKSGVPVGMTASTKAIIVQTTDGGIGVQGDAFNAGLQQGMAWAHANNVGALRALALTPAGNGSVMFFGANGFYYTSIPAALANTIAQLNAEGAELKQVIFNPDDLSGNSWCVLHGFNGFAQQGMSAQFVAMLERAQTQSQCITSVSVGTGGRFIISIGDGFSFAFNKIHTATLQQIQSMWKGGYYPKMFVFMPNGGAVIRYETRRVVPKIYIPSFNSDRRADLVLQEERSGAVKLLMLDSNNVEWTQTIHLAGTGYRVVATGDVDRDGFSDLILQNPSTGTAAWQPMFLSTPEGAPRPLDWQMPDKNWRLAAFCDMNGDGHADFVWQHSITRQISYWHMRDGNLGTVTMPALQLAANQTLVAARSFDADYKTIELILQNDTDGRIEVRAMSIAKPAVMVKKWLLYARLAPGWKVRAVEDCNGDGQRDLVVQRDSDGVVRMLLLGSLLGNIKQDAALTAHPGAAFRVAHNANRSLENADLLHTAVEQPDSDSRL